MVTDKDKLIEIFESQFEEFVDIKNKKVLHSFVTLLIDNLVYQKEFETHKYQVSSDIRLLIEKMEKGFELMEKRFEAVDKRFEAVDKRFEAVDKRFEDLIHYMDKRFNVTQWLIGILFVATNAMIVIMKLFL